ncbi:MAG: efflux RND transporter periplasmic adaptor subunit [Myxococcales bacterium]|nr:efflux RND transporter periplasmic adaptor subunit [Myxococcales bacterium]
MSRVIVLLLLGLAVGCDREAPAPHGGASEVSHPIPESELPTVTLTPEAIARLRIETTTVKEASIPASRLVGGEVVVPPGRAITVTAPVAGEVHFAMKDVPLPGTAVTSNAQLLRLTAIAPATRDTRARASREVKSAEANLQALDQRVERNQALIAQGAGSTRALEEATAARDVAKADLDAARAQSATLSRNALLSDVAMMVRAPSDGVVRSLAVAEGQPVAAGAPLFEIVEVDTLQLRVPVYSGDLARLDTSAAATVRRNGAEDSTEVHFVEGPPTAAPDQLTVDKYLALPVDAGFLPGERLLVELPLLGQTKALVVPASAVVFDAWGGAWVYRCEDERFTRARVDPARRVADSMVLAQGPPVGACVVGTGAVEIFGSEFPPGH